MINEIGSEFWEVDINNDSSIVRFDKPIQYLLTGRTALDFLIKDIKIEKQINKVYMPSFCCHSMIQPFIDNGVEIEFYDVYFENGEYTYKINFETQCDVIFIMQYFGYCNEKVSKIISKFNNIGKIIIEDATHSWFSEIPYNKKSNYVFASLRKWTGLPCGAIAFKQDGQFVNEPPSKTNLEYIQIRKKAAALKKQYIEKNLGQKEMFLKYFNQAESLLDIDYQNYNIIGDIKELIKKLDYKKIKETRRNNAEYLTNELNKQFEIETIIQSDKDIPLFVPIIVNNGKRDELREYLIDKGIYCPVHWPISNQHIINNKFLYENGLSLVCDQRYKLSDMKRVIETINKFYGG